MKTLLLNTVTKKLAAVIGLLFLFCASIRTANATVYVIVADDYSFSPSTTQCIIGDTIKWEWANGTHTTTSTDIPEEAAPWNQPLTMSNPTFSYVITVAGVYKYQCNYDYTMGMVGVINANPVNGIDEVIGVNKVLVYPNPVKSVLTITMQGNNDAKLLSLYSITGQKVYEKGIDMTAASQNQVINCEAFKEGMYLLTIEYENEGTVIRKIEIVR